MCLASLVLLVVSCAGCEPPCLRGHHESRHIAEYCHMDKLMQIGDVPIYGTVCDPPYNYQVFVCDQYQAEKP